MIADSRTLGRLLKDRRRELALTQAELAGRLGTTQSYVAAVERGGREARWSTVLEMARALELDAMLIPRERIAAVNAVLDLVAEDDVPPLTGDRW
ncbi:MAG: helix-turn-helix domain-containing protein [Candidatus Eremiobacteraeota bacterium]|nr:helix-turn-helix domain-containing protein [Candidatus Eremiobacteraeota bacterium]